MTITLKLLTGEPLQAEGYPLTFIIQHKGKKKKYRIGLSLPEHYIASEELISSRHPDFDTLFPDIMKYKMAARDILRERPDDVQNVYDRLFGKENKAGFLKAFADGLIAQMNATADKYEKNKDYVNANKQRGNAKVYQGALNQLELYRPGVLLEGITPALLEGFKEARLLKGNSKATVSAYLRTLSAIYNKAVKIYGLANKEPFKGVYAGLMTRKASGRKKYVLRDMVRAIEGITHQYESMARWTDLWLLQFYFGGADLIDVYYLKNSQLRNGRVYFERAKGNGGAFVDLAVHPKAQAIIDKYRTDGEYLFPWRKDTDGYKTFRRQMKRGLEKIQQRAGIELEGVGGKLGIKMVRHSFSNIAKRMGVDGDLLRELMGHERQDVDNDYKDLFPREVRDEALFRIIG